MNLAKLLLLSAPVLLVALTALPGALIKRAKAREAVQNVADFRDTLPVPADDLEPIDDETAEMESRWSQYWHNSACDALAIMLRADDHVNEMKALELALAGQCDEVVKRFAISAVERQRAIASKWGGWKSNTEREADLIIERNGGSLASFAHELAVEKAECTKTGSWNEAVQEELIEILNSEDAQQIAASVSAGRHRA